MQSMQKRRLALAEPVWQARSAEWLFCMAQDREESTSMALKTAVFMAVNAFELAISKRGVPKTPIGRSANSPALKENLALESEPLRFTPMSETNEAGGAGTSYLKWSGGEHPLRGPCVIGRRSDNDISISDMQVSRRHALVMSINDEWWLNDLGSRNGIIVNGMRLNSARRLRDRDDIRIGGHRMVFRGHQRGLPQSTIAGRTTHVAVEAPASLVPPSSVLCDLVIASAKGEVIEGVKAAHWFFGNTLRRAPGAELYQLPPVVCQWIQRLVEDPRAGSAPLELESENRRVVVSLARCKEDRYFLLLREESAQISIERLQSIGLTEREAEVMHWVCEGRNNPEIAKILNVTTHTVNRHLEHILNKLGVDNRQRAIMAAMERLGV